jgi:hypothetical protein
MKTMSKLFDRIHDLLKGEALDDFESYRRLVLKEARGKDSSAAEVTQCRALMARLNITEVKGRADVATIKRHISLTADVDGVDWAGAQCKAQAALKSIQAEIEQFVMTKQPEIVRLQAEFELAGTNAKAVGEKRVELVKLAREEWRILGLADPAIVSRTRHIAHQFRKSGLPSTGHEVFSFESLISQPQLHIVDRDGPHPHPVLDDYQIDPFEGQTVAERDELVEIAREAIVGEIDSARTPRPPQAAYLIADEDDAVTGFPIVARMNPRIMHTFGDTLRLVKENPPQFDPTQYRFIQHPGQPANEFKSFVGQLTKAWRDNPWQKQQARNEAAQAKAAAADFRAQPMAAVL